MNKKSAQKQKAYETTASRKPLFHEKTDINYLNQKAKKIDAPRSKASEVFFYLDGFR
ncbi:MAG: hypothetical protein ACREF7_02995 [Candidatus Saccharimonadales bacterium]